MLDELKAKIDELTDEERRELLEYIIEKIGKEAIKAILTKIITERMKRPIKWRIWFFKVTITPHGLLRKLFEALDLE